MINRFGKIMVYVKDPRVIADFWTNKIGFTEVGQQEMNHQILYVELAPSDISDCHLVLFNREIVKEMSEGISLETPSILFGSYDIDTMRRDLIAKGVTVGEIIKMSSRTFNFADNEGNYFAVEEINIT